MIKSTAKGNIFGTKAKHIAFAINTEGINDCGFAGQVAEYWPELANIGPQELGTVLSKTIGDKTYHGLVCHSLKKGWGNEQDKVIKACFDAINVDDNEVISSIAIGTGFIGMASGANSRKILCGMMESKKTIQLYGPELEEVKRIYAEERHVEQ